jgi:hypothetical protein
MKAITHVFQSGNIPSVTSKSASGTRKLPGYYDVYWRYDKD